MMVVKLMIILTWIFATVSTLGWNVDNPTVICCLALSWCLLSEDRFYFCTDGLLLCWVRNAPSA